jgi:hypothetical protein
VDIRLGGKLAELVSAIVCEDFVGEMILCPRKRRLLIRFRWELRCKNTVNADKQNFKSTTTIANDCDSFKYLSTAIVCDKVIQLEFSSNLL